MPQPTLHVIARFHALPGKASELGEVLQGLVEPTRAEAGCLSYRLLHSREDPARFAMVEEWTGEDALHRHFETEHIRAGRERFGDLLAEPLDVAQYAAL